MSDKSKLRVKINKWRGFKTPSVLLHIREGKTDIVLEDIEAVARHVLGMYEELATLRRALEKACEEMVAGKPHISNDVKWWQQYFMELAEEER